MCIFDEASDIVVPESGLQIGHMPEYLEMAAIISVQSVFRPEPDEPPAVLDYLADRVLRQTILDVDSVEIQGLGVRGQKCREQEKQ